MMVYEFSRRKETSSSSLVKFNNICTRNGLTQWNTSPKYNNVHYKDCGCFLEKLLISNPHKYRETERD